jgi:hypothetical protein
VGRPISLNHIPNVTAAGHKTGWIAREVEEFLSSGAEAWELKEYGTANSARSSTARINRVAREKGLPLAALSRGKVVYLRRPEPTPPKARM